jgi:hypothetical protein
LKWFASTEFGWEREKKMSEETLGRNIRSKATRKRQIVTNSRKSLIALAAKRAEKSNSPFIPPSEDEIKAECKRRWQESQERQMPKEDVSEYFM